MRFDDRKIARQATCAWNAELPRPRSMAGENPAKESVRPRWRKPAKNIARAMGPMTKEQPVPAMAAQKTEKPVAPTSGRKAQQRPALEMVTAAADLSVQETFHDIMTRTMIAYIPNTDTLGTTLLHSHHSHLFHCSHARTLAAQ